jgi:hypothetical protein
MEKAYFKEKIDAMMPDLIEGIRKECDRLYECGGIDTSTYNNDYRLPKTILSVAIENQVRQYTLHDDKIAKRAMANLRHF